VFGRLRFLPEWILDWTFQMGNDLNGVVL
jgi:hypothetical protein